MVKLCKDCSRCEGSGEYAKCTAPAGRRRIIQRTGFEPPTQYARWKYCSIQREDSFPLYYITNSCGATGRWWEPK